MTATAYERAERRKAWAFALPALLWTSFFFLVPFVYMAAISFWTRQGNPRSEHSRRGHPNDDCHSL